MVRYPLQQQADAISRIYGCVAVPGSGKSSSDLRPARAARSLMIDSRLDSSPAIG